MKLAITQSNSAIVAARAELAKRARQEAARRGLRLPGQPDSPIDDAQDGMSIVDWLAKHFYIPEAPGRLVVADYQAKCLQEALSKDDSGLYRYSTVVWSDIKKSAKTTIAAGVSLYIACATPWGSIKIVANDQRQADTRVSAAVRKAVILHPVLKHLAVITNHNILLPNQANIEAIPVDPGGEAGGNDDLIVFSELWAATSKAAQRMWTEMTLSPTKFGKSLRWVESYAGFEGSSTQLKQLYTQGVEQGRLLFDDIDAYGNKPARLFCLWNKEPRLPWQTKEYYDQERASLIPNEFDRVHGNEWVSSTAAFIDKATWELCEAALPQFKPAEPLIVAVDAGVNRDNFAIVGVSRRGTQFYVRYVKIFQPPAKGKDIDYRLPELELRRLGVPQGKPIKLDKELREYYLSKGFTEAQLTGLGFNMPIVWYDQFQLIDMAQRLKQVGVAHFKKFSQQADRAIADKALYDIIREGRLIYSNQPELTKHVLSADVKLDNGRMRIVHRNNDDPVDGCVGLSMACTGATKLNI